MSEFATEQEAFWAGDFGTQYIERNGMASVPTRLAWLRRALQATSDIRSVMEFGANIGSNLHALHRLLPLASLSGLELNPKAFEILAETPWIEAERGSLLEDRAPDAKYDLSFTSGVLIHIAPQALPQAYDRIVNASKRYVLVAEYYNPTPTEVSYRGHQEKLFKRDFAGEIMERHPSLALVDYGFVYRRDPQHPMDDLTWFLMEKQSGRGEA